MGVFNDTILARLDDLLFEASLRGIKVTVALHDRWSLGCWRSDVYQVCELADHGPRLVLS